MVILDTNVISETGREQPDPTVDAWIMRRDLQSMFLAAPGVGELMVGVELMPVGQRRSRLTLWLQTLMAESFFGRVLAFDVEAARHFGRLTATGQRLGRPAGIVDAQIAAVAALHGMAVATRDVGHFEPFGIPIINPWTDD